VNSGARERQGKHSATLHRDWQQKLF